jgi:hypothetical protein
MPKVISVYRGTTYRRLTRSSTETCQNWQVHWTKRYGYYLEGFGEPPSSGADRYETLKHHNSQNKHFLLATLGQGLEYASMAQLVVGRS